LRRGRWYGKEKRKDGRKQDREGESKQKQGIVATGFTAEYGVGRDTHVIRDLRE